MNTVLKQAIIDAGFTVSGFAESINYTPMAVYKWIYETSAPNVYTALMISEKLNVSIYKLFGGVKHD